MNVNIRNNQRTTHRIQSINNINNKYKATKTKSQKKKQKSKYKIDFEKDLRSITNSINFTMSGNPTTTIEQPKKSKSKINIDSITTIPDKYPEHFTKFCSENNLTPPKINTGNGKALALMLVYPDNYFTRKECDAITSKFNIKTNDSIQLFNKHEQIGIKCSEKRGQYYIEYPYKITNKNKMRKDFKYDGTNESKNAEIDNIKSHLMGNYIKIPNEEWQLGHKNPDIEDNTNVNLVLQPPIQGKYRDNFIFIDTFTKIPTPKKFKQMIENTESPYSQKQLIELRDFLNSLKL